MLTFASISAKAQAEMNDLCSILNPTALASSALYRQRLQVLDVLQLQLLIPTNAGPTGSLVLNGSESDTAFTGLA